MKVDVHMQLYLAEFFLEWEMFQRKFAEKYQNMLSIVFPKIVRFACRTTKATDTHSDM